MRYLHAVIALLATILSVSADEKLKGIACRSVHLGYSGPAGSAFYNEMTVDASADGTYFMAAGFRGGYFGLQEKADGKKVVIFSVWDSNAGNDPKSVPAEKRVKTLHTGEGVRIGRFGGEGTGGQSFLDYDWKLGTNYRFLVTATADGDDRTAFSGYFYLPEKKAWKHLVQFSTITKETSLAGYYSFVEDFRRNKVSTTKVRTANFGNGWVKDAGGKWTELAKARFTADSNPALNIDAGPAAEGKRFFLSTGGETANATTKLKETIARTAGGTAPADLPGK